MKKPIGILLAVALAVTTLAACNATTPNQFGVPWTATSAPSEYTEYEAKIEKLAETEDEKNIVVAEGVQKTYLRPYTVDADDGALYEGTQRYLYDYERTNGAGEARFPDCLVMTTIRTLTYLDIEQNKVYDDDGNLVSDKSGQTDVQQDEVVFSYDTHTLMQTRYVVSVRAYASDPTLNYACEAIFGNGLTVRRFRQRNDGSLELDENGAPKVSATHSFKANKVAATTYDNSQLLLVTRYASGFGNGWSGSFRVVNLAEICYSGDLADAIFSISVREGDSRPNVPDSYDDSAITGSEEGGVSLAKTDDENGKYIPCRHTTFSRSGSLAASYGPQFFADYASARAVITGAELANVLVRYEQYIPYTDVNRLTDNEFLCSLVLRYAARRPRTAD